jgi:hypothetical protein
VTHRAINEVRLKTADPNTPLVFAQLEAKFGFKESETDQTGLSHSPSKSSETVKQASAIHLQRALKL